MYMKKFIFATLVFCSPLITFAATTPTDFKSFVELLLGVLKNIISIFFAALIAGLVYGIALYMMNSDNEKRREEIKPYLLWAIIGIAVVLGMWGLIGILNSTLFGGSFGIPFLSTPS
ncbi:MAG: hypothetical protein A2845_02945 [Candidatus Lloydbacteria bacterium RIFCSPHIGHO2_01_FULL_49_22]|uniref:TrbC/VirB2 family protein n=1 Tax=Candidatus Lloydbacteria bacterium RIFCSPHIGHO2_01_FULL_49_22 TaxID=1798658 RepID=A0A1G2CV67_9BACT|nr:MAG: hypothetical protein A2845_02945 [Candidatus Lloydbacteria bacterium RIFCSPHIGHO2_01_FULL_49_22]OGZ10398.1 MAG: hypothetical protein A3C14_02645 [Candidatus Lloydbacteria bacterium RIFCSPHIGHO2_02_FULL_50_18]